MPWTEISVDKYAIIHQIVLNADRTKSYINTIACYFQGNKIGEIGFYKNQIPDSYVSYSTSTPSSPFRFHLFYELDRYQDIIETFRYEKPIKVSFNSDKINTPLLMANVSTSEEPIGEQEGPGVPSV